MPPPLLRVKVAGTADRSAFVAQSAEAAKTIREALAASGKPIEAVKSLLESPETLRCMGQGAARAAAAASGSAGRSLEALERFGLMP